MTSAAGDWCPTPSNVGDTHVTDAAPSARLPALSVGGERAGRRRTAAQPPGSPWVRIPAMHDNARASSGRGGAMRAARRNCSECVAWNRPCNAPTRDAFRGVVMIGQPPSRAGCRARGAAAGARLRCPQHRTGLGPRPAPAVVSHPGRRPSAAAIVPRAPGPVRGSRGWRWSPRGLRAGGRPASTAGPGAAPAPRRRPRWRTRARAARGGPVRRRAVSAPADRRARARPSPGRWWEWPGPR